MTELKKYKLLYRFQTEKDQGKQENYPIVIISSTLS